MAAPWENVRERKLAQQAEAIHKVKDQVLGLDKSLVGSIVAVSNSDELTRMIESGEVTASDVAKAYITR